MKLIHLYNKSLRLMAAMLLCALSCSGLMAANKYVVVIDAGHGGKDHGAIDNNVREKDINLNVALKLGDYIKKHGKNIKVVYTRDKDEYLTLQQRADKANKAKGDLFISIHTNSVDKSNPNRTKVEGASTYTLGLHKNDNNMNVARRENSVMTLENNYETKYSGFDPQSDESYIIFEMAQKANMANSVKFAEQVQKQLTKQAGRKDRGVHQAGFWVLWATSMPSVLVELDFICNPTTAKFLSSKSGEDQLAKGIGTATIAYFKALEQHDKNRLKSENNGDEDLVPAFSNGEEGVVLAEATEEVKKSAAPIPVAERTRKPANRRRRSDASREKSERQEYAEAVIKEENVYIDHSAVDEPAPAAVQPKAQPAASAKKNSKDNKNKNKNKNDRQSKPKAGDKQMAAAKPSAKPAAKPVGKPAGKVVAKPAAKPAKNDKTMAKADKSKATAQTDTTGKSPVRLSKVTTVYKIQLLASSERLKAGSPLFQGLSPVTCIAEGDVYKYVYGESTNRNEIYHMLSDVQKKIPDAQVIKVKKAL